MEEERSKAVCGQESLDLLNCVVQSPYDQEKCLLLLQKLRECMLNKSNYVDIEVEQLIQVALLCTQSSPMEWLKMSEVVRMLEGDGLAERWEEWQKVEVVRQEIDLALSRSSEWILDSTENLHAVELFGPR